MTETDLRWKREVLEEVDSTNRLAAQRVVECWNAAASPEGLVIIAERQTAGRGQHGRQWESPPGGVYLSVVLETAPVDWRPRLALVAGMVMIDALGDCPGLQIRWPNDVMLGTRKVAGILCEGMAQGNRWAVVVGMGINVEPVALSEPLREGATSLWAEGFRISKTQVVEGVLAQWSRAMREKTGLDAIIGRVRGIDALRGRQVRMKVGDEIWEGTGAGIDDEGRLLMRLADGDVKAFDHGSIVHG